MSASPLPSTRDESDDSEYSFSSVPPGIPASNVHQSLNGGFDPNSHEVLQPNVRHSWVKVQHQTHPTHNHHGHHTDNAKTQMSTLHEPLLMSSTTTTTSSSPLFDGALSISPAPGEILSSSSDSTTTPVIKKVNTELLIASTALLFGWVANNIGWIYCSMYFGPLYAFWMSQSTAAIYLLMQGPVIAYKLWSSKTITKEMRSTVDWKVYFIMGLLDTLYNLLTSVSSPYTSGPAQNLIFQLPVPIAMVTVKLIWPRTRYYRGQYVGAVIIVVGATLSVLPQLIHPPSSDDSSDNGGEQDNRLSALIVYTIGVIFYGINTVYKEYSLKNAPTIDYWYMSFVENSWVFVLSFVFWPMLWIPGVSVDTVYNTWDHFKGGAVCMFEGTSPPEAHATCDHIFLISCIWIVSNVFVNVVGLQVCRVGDSVVFNIVNSVQLPLTNLCLSSAFIMTAALAAPFSYTLWIALACVSVGFIIYQFLPLERVVPEEEINSDSESSSSAANGASKAPELSCSPASLTDLTKESLLSQGERNQP